MLKHPVLELPIKDVMREEIALPLQHVLKIYTVGSFLNAWQSPEHQKSIERIFESPQQWVMPPPSRRMARRAHGGGL